MQGIHRLNRSLKRSQKRILCLVILKKERCMISMVMLPLMKVQAVQVPKVSADFMAITAGMEQAIRNIILKVVTWMIF